MAEITDAFKVNDPQGETATKVVSYATVRPDFIDELAESTEV